MSSRPEDPGPPGAAAPARLRDLFAGRRGRLMAGLLLAELAGALQVVAVSGVLPLAAQELDGRQLYGAALAAGPLAATALLVLTPQLMGRLGARGTLVLATGVLVVGVVLTAGAPTMGWVVAGSVLRGAAAGLLGGFGLSAVGALYDDALRPRVLGLYAAVWLVPSTAGPLANALIASFAGWRWAIAWPVLLVVAARVVVGRYAPMVPVASAARRVPLASGALLVAGLALASAAPVLPGPLPLVALGGGAALALAATSRLVRTLVGNGGPRRRAAAGMVGVSAAYFGLQGVVSLAVLDALGAGVGASSLALGAGLVTWAATGLRPPAGGRVGRLDGTVAGSALLAVACALVAVAVLASGSTGTATAVALVVTGFGAAGLGMGLAYPLFSSRPFDGVERDRVSAVAAGVELSEYSGTVLGAVAGGVVFSVVSAAGAGPGTAVAAATLGCLAAAGLTVRTASRRPSPADGAG